MKLTIELEVDEKTLEEWIEFVTKYPDIFMPGCCGYWLFGVKRNETGWLAWEHNDECVEYDHHEPAEAAWEFRNSHPGDRRMMPPRYFVINREVAIKAYVEGIKRGGVGWYENGDASEYDCVLQLALLGEIRYG